MVPLVDVYYSGNGHPHPPFLLVHAGKRNCLSIQLKALIGPFGADSAERDCGRRRTGQRATRDPRLLHSMTTYTTIDGDISDFFDAQLELTNQFRCDELFRYLRDTPSRTLRPH